MGPGLAGRPKEEGGRRQAHALRGRLPAALHHDCSTGGGAGSTLSSEGTPRPTSCLLGNKALAAPG